MDAKIKKSWQNKIMQNDGPAPLSDGPKIIKPTQKPMM